MTEAAKNQRRAYYQKYREDHRDHLREYRRKWGKENPDKVKQYRENYWNRKAAEALEGGAADV